MARSGGIVDGETSSVAEPAIVEEEQTNIVYLYCEERRKKFIFCLSIRFYIERVEYDIYNKNIYETIRVTVIFELCSN